ncbi:hypothetical protein D9M71_385690 [compost metagenome]
MDGVQHAVTGGQRQGQAQGVAEQQRGGGELLAQTLPDLAQAVRVTVVQGAVLLLGQRLRIARRTEQLLEGAEVAGQCAQRAQQAAPLRVVLRLQVVEGGAQVVERLGAGALVVEWLAQLDGRGQRATGLALLAQQQLAAEQHVAVEERLGQAVVRVVRGAGALVDVLGEEVQLQVAADLRAGAALADPVEDDLLGGVERRHQAAVLLRQLQAALLDVEFAHRLEQRCLEAQVQAQFAEYPGQRLLHRLLAEQRLPEHREQAVPGRAGDQQQRLAPQVGDLAAALVDADHGVDRQDQGARGDGAVALAERAEQGQAEGRQRQRGDEQPGIGEQQLDGEGRGGEAQQGH